MKTRWRSSIFITTLLALAIPLSGAVAQQHHHYKLIDMGTFGGPTSYLSNGFDGILNNRGTAVGWADTSTPDPTCNNPDCFVAHAFESRDGVLADLGALPGGGNSQAVWISANGLIAGVSQIAQIDPSLPGGPAEVRAVLWRNGVATDLGVLPQGGFDTLAFAVNSRGQVVGWGLDTVPDPFSLQAPGFFTTQTRAFLWESGTMHDLGTLGGTDAAAALVNERGQIVGTSYTNSTPNPVTGFPTVDPFLWENGTMVDLGTLGGTSGSVSALNNRGEVVGQSNLAGDLTSHPFLWTKTGGMQDLGTLGGNTGLTNWINDTGAIAGKADLPGPLPQNHDAVLWRHGSMIDLGTLPGDSCSNAYYVNARGQVVGTSENRDLCLLPTGEHAFLWEDGGPMVDLNSLIAPGSKLELTFAFAINDPGEIVGIGVPSGCDPANIDSCGHAYLLIPCDENHPGLEGCDYSPVDAVQPQTALSAGTSGNADEPNARTDLVRAATTTASVTGPVISDPMVFVCTWLNCPVGHILITTSVTSPVPIADVQFTIDGRSYTPETRAPYGEAIGYTRYPLYLTVTATDAHGGVAKLTTVCHPPWNRRCQ